MITPFDLAEVARQQDREAAECEGLAHFYSRQAQLCRQSAASARRMALGAAPASPAEQSVLPGEDH